ncbi:MAG TPA: TIR domain-containing protein [Pseudonocardiaceae bacterium]
MSGGVFINYRGEDTRSYSALLYQELARRLGNDLVFLDSESIEAGADFAREILGRVRSCQALLAVIGPHWLTAAHPSGLRRIDDPQDWIRRELVEAFAVGTTVIPILTDDAVLPTAQELPADIAALAGRQFRRLRHRDATTDLHRIVTEVTRGDPRLADAARRQAETSVTGPTRQLAAVTGAPPSDDTNAGSIHGDASGFPATQDTLARTADELADVVRDRWRHEEERRKIQDPVPLPVRWETADEAVMDHWANICLAQAGETADPLDLHGRLDQIADSYRRIPSGRLVVLGRAGSGKTILGLRFVLDLLDTRMPGEPVPEIFSFGSWNPTIEPLKDWLSGQLSRDQPGLATVGTNGETLAAALVGKGLILPVLDGFDEIADGLHPAALEELSATTLPLMLTSRSTEYAAAVAGTRGLTRAAAVELADLTLDDLADYLLRSSSRAATPEWHQVLAELRHNPDIPASANLSRVLTTPLMVALARAVYSESDRSRRDDPKNRPVTLLDGYRFSTQQNLEDHLLGSFLPSVYRPRPGESHTAHTRSWDPERAQAWLGYLARHLDQLGTRDLAWWELAGSVPRSVRTVVIMFLAGLSLGCVNAVGNVPVDLVATSLGLDFAIHRGLVVGFLHGLMCALAVGLLYWHAEGTAALKPSLVRMRLFHGPRLKRPPYVARITSGAVVGLLYALALLFVDRLVVPRLGIDDGLGGGLVSPIELVAELALAAGLVFGLLAWMEVPIDVSAAVSPGHMLRSNRANTVTIFVVWALGLGLVTGLVASFTQAPLRSVEVGLVFGLEGAFGVGVGYGLCLTAWGQWVAIARIWLPLTGRLPWRLVAFLNDACRRGALRRAGAVYQFRHARLQDHLIVVPKVGGDHPESAAA